MTLCLFEDALAAQLHPLTYFRPVYDLRSGMLSLRERAVLMLKPRAVALHCRAELRALMAESDPAPLPAAGPVTLLNGRVLMTRALAQTIRAAAPSTCLTAGETPVAAILSAEDFARLRPCLEADAVTPQAFSGMRTTPVDAALVQYPWDLVYAIASSLETDLRLLQRTLRHRAAGAAVHASVIQVKRNQIWIGRRAEVGPGVVLDAGHGPIIIGDGARIFPNAVLEGPCFIGPGAQIKIGAQIYGGTSIGAQCKVGGEVEEVIFHSHANKQHDGFLGHSYICPWVNLGAGTTSSNLKNTYGSVRVTIDGTSIDSGRMFVGLMAGDHAKTGINVTLNTGTVLGPFVNVYGHEMPSKEVSPFSWGSGADLAPYDLAKATEVAVTVMRRRSIEPSPAYLQLIRTLHQRREHGRPASTT